MKHRLGLPGWVLIGALAGIVAGLFLGDYAQVLEPIGRAYIQLLAINVYPYVIASLLHGLGKLEPPTARRLFKHAWPAYLIGWGITMLAMTLLGTVFLTVMVPAVLDPKAAVKGPSFIELLIPANPFLDLTTNMVPAVVLFAFLYGIAIQRAKNKSGWMEFLLVVKSASVTIWNWTVFVAPVGVFALLASAAGTMRSRDIAGLLLYTALYIAGSFLLAFWVIPAFLACVIPAGYKEVLHELRGAFVLAMVTTLSVAAVPGIIKATENMLAKCQVKDEMASDIIGTNVSIAYPLTQLGNLGVILFFYFCAFYFKTPLALGDRILLPFLTLLSTVGSPSTTVNAVPFLASVFHTPESTLSLWVAPMAFTRYPQTVLSVAGFALTTLWPTLAFYGKTRLRPVRIAGILSLGLILLGGVVVALRASRPNPLPRPQSNYMSYSLAPELTRGLSVTVYRTPEEVPKRAARELALEGLDRIRSEGVLRIGYDPIVIPFCYLNNRGQLVGYDVAFMHRLAKEMGVRLEYVPMTLKTMVPMLASGEIDIAANGVFVTEGRMRAATVSRPYFQTPPALLARGTVARGLLSRESIRQQTGLKVACLDSPALLPLAQALFPKENVVLVRSYDELLTNAALQVAPWSLLEARAFALAHRGFTAVVPEDIGSPFLIAYLMPPKSQQLQSYVDRWIEIQQANGFAQEQYRYWIEGIPSETKEQRWSILRNVLRWVD